MSPWDHMQKPDNLDQGWVRMANSVIVQCHFKTLKEYDWKSVNPVDHFTKSKEKFCIFAKIATYRPNFCFPS